jgi:hypothetical protein
MLQPGILEAPVLAPSPWLWIIGLGLGLVTLGILMMLVWLTWRAFTRHDG